MFRCSTVQMFRWGPVDHCIGQQCEDHLTTLHCCQSTETGLLNFIALNHFKPLLSVKQTGEDLAINGLLHRAQFRVYFTKLKLDHNHWISHVNVWSWLRNHAWPLESVCLPLLHTKRTFSQNPPTSQFWKLRGVFPTIKTYPKIMKPAMVHFSSQESPSHPMCRAYRECS